MLRRRVGDREKKNLACRMQQKFDMMLLLTWAARHRCALWNLA
jgi:hypothetical protein